MINNLNYLDTLSNSKNIQEMLNGALLQTERLYKKDLKYLKIDNYEYDPDEAIEELGLDLDLINQLLEDYTRQIIISQTIFLEHIKQLQENKKNNISLDYTPLRDFAHKNLGVARNLRIEDAEKILFRMMKDDDLEYLLKYLDALIASTIILKPECAYNALLVMKMKDSF